MRLLLIAIISCCASAHAAEVYKCVNADGGIKYSQKACAKNAEVVTVNTNTTAGANFSGDDFSKFDAQKASDRRAKNISGGYDRIDRLRAERDNKINRLKREQRYTTNNLAGATYNQSIATEMKAVGDDYNARIDMEMQEINALKAEQKQK